MTRWSRMGLHTRLALARRPVRWPQPDFVRQPGPAGSLAYGVLALGLVLLTGAGVGAWQAYQAWTVAQAQQQTAQATHAALARPQRGLLPQQDAAQSSVHARAQDAAAARAARALQAGLRPAWGELLQTLEAAAALQVRWLGLERDAERGELRLQGSAPQVEAVVDTVRMLMGQPGWSEVGLTRLGPETGPSSTVPMPGMPGMPGTPPGMPGVPTYAPMNAQPNMQPFPTQAMLPMPPMPVMPMVPSPPGPLAAPGDGFRFEITARYEPV